MKVIAWSVRPSRAGNGTTIADSSRSSRMIRAVLRVPSACFEQGSRDLGVELRPPASNDLRHAARRVRVGRVALAELARVGHFRRVGVSDLDLLRRRGPRFHDRDRAPIGELRNREARDRGKGLPVVERRDERIGRLGKERASSLRALYGGDVAEDEHDAVELPVLIADRRPAVVVDRDLPPVARAQDGMVRQADHGPFPEHLRDGALDRFARRFREDPKHVIHRPAPRASCFGPSGQSLRDRVHERDTALGVGRDHGIADALQRRRKPAPRFVLALVEERALEPLGAVLPEGAHEGSLRGRERARGVKSHRE